MAVIERTSICKIKRTVQCDIVHIFQKSRLNRGNPGILLDRMSALELSKNYIYFVIGIMSKIEIQIN